MSDSMIPELAGYGDLTLIANGSTALVFRALQQRLNRTVAVKVLLVDNMMTTEATFARELEMTVALSNQPHIVSIIDTGVTDGGQPYIVMEYCEGGSYAQILKQRGPLPVHEVLEVGTKIGEALHAAHQMGIIHRDVKPPNILRSRFGPALTDFGIARAPDDLAGTTTVEKMTPHHASPEALLLEAQSGLSDVYSLASTLWNLLAGYPPFVEPGRQITDALSFRERVLREPVPAVPRADVPAWLQQELATAMAKRAEHRHASAQAFADSLRWHSYSASMTASAGAIAWPVGSPRTTPDSPDGPASEGENQPTALVDAAPSAADPTGHHPHLVPIDPFAKPGPTAPAPPIPTTRTPPVPLPPAVPTPAAAVPTLPLWPDPPASGSLGHAAGAATGTPVSGGPSTGTPVSGGPSTGTPVSGGPSTGMPVSGGPSTGTPVSGGPLTGNPISGGPSTGTPASGPPYGMPASGPPYGMPASGPPYGTPASGAPASGAPYGMPASGAPYGTPASGVPYGAVTSGVPYGGQSVSGVPGGSTPVSVAPVSVPAAGGYPGGGERYGTAGWTQTQVPAWSGPPSWDGGGSGAQDVDEGVRSRFTLVAAVAALVVLAIAAVVGLVLWRSGQHPAPTPGAEANASATAGPTGRPAPTGSVKLSSKPPPTNLKLDDKGGTIVISWSDPSGGTVSFVVFEAQEGRGFNIGKQVPAGTTSVPLDGLNPSINYCFIVSAAYSVDDLAASVQVCTNRKPASPR